MKEPIEAYVPRCGDEMHRNRDGLFATVAYADACSCCAGFVWIGRPDLEPREVDQCASTSGGTSHGEWECVRRCSDEEHAMEVEVWRSHCSYDVDDYRDWRRREVLLRYGTPEERDPSLVLCSTCGHSFEAPGRKA